MKRNCWKDWQLICQTTKTIPCVFMVMVLRGNQLCSKTTASFGWGTSQSAGNSSLCNCWGVSRFVQFQRFSSSKSNSLSSSCSWARESKARYLCLAVWPGYSDHWHSLVAQLTFISLKADFNSRRRAGCLFAKKSVWFINLFLHGRRYRVRASLGSWHSCSRSRYEWGCGYAHHPSAAIWTLL